MINFQPLDQLLQSYIDRGLPNCSCIIARKGEILYENYFGYADIENQIALTSEHLFRQASLTKIALYTVGMMLYEQGKFLMSDPLYEYFPEYRHTTKLIRKSNGMYEEVPVEHPIILKHVFNMTCGLPYELIIGGIPVNHPTAQAMSKAMEPLRAKGYFTLREQIRAVAAVPVAFEPGTRFLYGFSSELMAGLLEALTGKAAELAIKEMLFDPLDMKNSANFLLGDMEARLVKNYCLRPGKQLGELDALYIPSSSQEAFGVGKLGTVPGFSRVITNCLDYTKLLQMLANNGIHNGKRIIGHKTIDLMRTNTLTPTMIEEDFSNTYLAGYGYGYGVRTLLNRHVGQNNGNPGQFGWTGGSGTWAEADPSTGTSIVYMHNLLPNFEEYHHLRMRAAAFGCLSD